MVWPATISASHTTARGASVLAMVRRRPTSFDGEGRSHLGDLPPTAASSRGSFLSPRTAEKCTPFSTIDARSSMGSQRHLRAMNRALKAAGADRDPIYAPFVELARDMARVIDGADGSISTRNLAAYRALLKELTRIAARPDRASTTMPATTPGNVTPSAELDRLRAFREAHL